MSHKRNSVMRLVLVALSTLALLPAQNSARLNEELPAGAMQQKATTACLGCHEARIVVQQRLSKTAWTKEVDKMVKWGAVVDADDRDVLIDYLSTNFSQDRAAYDAPRSSREKHPPRIRPRKAPTSRRQSATDPVSRRACEHYGSAANTKPQTLCQEYKDEDAPVIVHR